MEPEQFITIAEKLPFGLFVANNSAKYTYVNQAACDITGYSYNELTQMKIADLMFTYDLQAAFDHFNKLVANGSAYSELPIRHKSGHKRWITVDGIKLNENLFAAFCRDITENFSVSRMPANLANRRFQAILKALPDLLFILDKNGVYIDYHISDKTKLIVQPEEFLDRNMKDVLPDEIYQPSKKALKKTLETGGPESFSYEIDTDAGLLYFKAIMTRMADDLALVIIREITNEKLAELSLNEKISELEKFNNLMIGREARMLELKEEINLLREKLGLPPKYKEPENPHATGVIL